MKCELVVKIDDETKSWAAELEPGAIVLEAIEANKNYIMTETLALSLENESGNLSGIIEFESEDYKLGLKISKK